MFNLGMESDLEIDPFLVILFIYIFPGQSIGKKKVKVTKPHTSDFAIVTAQTPMRMISRWSTQSRPTKDHKEFYFHIKMSMDQVIGSNSVYISYQGHYVKQSRLATRRLGGLWFTASYGNTGHHQGAAKK